MSAPAKAGVQPRRNAAPRGAGLGSRLRGSIGGGNG